MLKPEVIVPNADVAHLSLDITEALNFSDTFELGASYRINEGIGGLLFFNAADWIDLGYAYEVPFDSIVQAATNGTHEVFKKFKM